MPDTRRKSDNENFVQKLLRYWPIFILFFAVISAGFAIQAQTVTNSRDISGIKEQIAQIQKSVSAIREHNSKMGERSVNTQNDVKDIKQDVKDILIALRNNN
jgi:septal ring factor EnvC (AmiA/AmiB activator)